MDVYEFRRPEEREREREREVEAERTEAIPSRRYANSTAAAAATSEISE